MTERQEDDWWHGYSFAEWIDDTYCYDPTRKPDAERPVDVDDAEERDR